MPRAQFSLRSVSLGGLVLLVVVGCGQAQIDRATLTGTVTDPTRAVVRDAKIHAKDQATGLESEAESNSQGVYRVPGLAVGTYTVTVTHTGFATAQFQDVVLLVGETRTLDTHLKVGAVMQKIVVEVAPTALEETSPELSGVIRSREIESLPVNGRNWASLLLLAPGAIDDGGGDQRTIRFAGRARDDNNFMIDGVDATQAQKSTTRLQISEDAISEYRVSSALYSAEYGAGAGGQVDTRLQSGGWSHPRFRNITARPKASSLVHSGKIAAPIPAARIANHSPRRIISNWCRASDMLRLWSESPSSTALRSACFMTRSASSISARRF